MYNIFIMYIYILYLCVCVAFPVLVKDTVRVTEIKRTGRGGRLQALKSALVGNGR